MKKICAKILIMALVLQSVYLTINVTNESAKAATLNLHNPTMVMVFRLGIAYTLELIGKVTRMGME